MTTVPTIVQKLVERSEYLRDAISQDLINLSELARQYRSEVERELIKPVSEASIIMALKRYAHTIKYDKNNRIDFSIYIGDISVKSGLFDITFANSPELYGLIAELMSGLDDKLYFTFIKGIWQTTMIASEVMESEILRTFQDQTLENTIRNLSAVTIKLQNGHIDQPGLVSHILSKLSWQGINLVEVVSTFDELTVIIEDEQVSLAFDILRKISK